jgi:hypothetical protein
MRPLPLILAFMIGFQPLGEAFFYFWYLADNDSFTSVFCENTEKPELQCNGKCHLTAIAETEAPASGDDPLPAPLRLEIAPPPPCEVDIPIACITTNDNAFPYEPLPGGDWIASLLRPPIWKG